jgi:hypothetical protein
MLVNGSLQINRNPLKLVVLMKGIPSEVSKYLAKIGKKGGSAKVAKGFAISTAASEASRSRWGDLPRCACGEMTAKRAKARGHKCG